MDLKLLEYMVAIERYGTMSKAAERLFITSSALNQQLLKLERELDLQLFFRNHRKMTPTKAGEIYLDAAKQMLSLRQATYAKLEDYAGQWMGTYQVGLTFDHGADVFVHIFPAFHEQYPGVHMCCCQLLVVEMLEMLSNNELDLAFTLALDPVKHPELTYIPISSENLLLGVHKSHPAARGMVPSETPCSVADMSAFRGDSFALSSGNSTMRTELLNPIFEASGYQPDVMLESPRNDVLERMAITGNSAAIIPESQVHDRENVVWFYLPGSPRFEFAVVHNKGYRLSNALKTFIAMAKADAEQRLHFPPPALS